MGRDGRIALILGGLAFLVSLVLVVVVLVQGASDPEEEASGEGSGKVGQDQPLAPTGFQRQASLPVFAPIARRAAGEQPISTEELFDDEVKKLTFKGRELRLRETKADPDCAAAVWGNSLREELGARGCTRVLRASYSDPDDRYLGQFAVLDVADVRSADSLLNAFDPNRSTGFVLPLTAKTEGFGKGHTEATAQAMGHYVVIAWVGRADGKPDDTLISQNVLLMNASEAIYERVQRAKGSGG
ncbi:MAG: hypothetical protein GEV11_26280 [Streptosporangiales bacterium]|nr:hypothetical protein [Streptosporangiales bacterium]